MSAVELLQHMVSMLCQLLWHSWVVKRKRQSKEPMRAVFAQWLPSTHPLVSLGLEPDRYFPSSFSQKSGTFQRLSSSAGSNSSASNQESQSTPSSGPRGPNPMEGIQQLIETVNERIRGYGFTDINVGGFTVQPSHLLIALVLLFLIGPFGLVIGVAICFFTQPRGTGGARPSALGNSGAGPSGSRQQPPPAGPRPFGGAGQRLGGN